MRYINLTPHAVTILSEDGAVLAEYPASGQVARVATIDHGPILEDGGHAVSYGDITGLQHWGDSDEDTVYIVSLVTMLAVAASGDTRDDLRAPWGEVRDDSGRAIGCRGLHRIARYLDIYAPAVKSFGVRDIDAVFEFLGLGEADKSVEVLHSGFERPSWGRDGIRVTVSNYGTDDAEYVVRVPDAWKENTEWRQFCKARPFTW